MQILRKSPHDTLYEDDDDVMLMMIFLRFIFLREKGVRLYSTSDTQLYAFLFSDYIDCLTLSVCIAKRRMHTAGRIHNVVPVDTAS